MFKDLIRKNKYLYTYIKFRKQLKVAQKNYREYDYKHSLLYIAGLPKSGTSWLENMLSEFPGFEKIMLPEAVKFEQRNRGSHFLELKKVWLERLDDSLTVLKLHNYGSKNNAQVLKELQIPYIVLYRDLRDVSISYYFYVKKTWHHPEYEDYKELDVEEGLNRFADTLLPDFKEWIDSWRKNFDPESGMIVRYEDLKKDTPKQFKKIVRHYGLPEDEQQIKNIIQKNSFEAKSGGRKRGEENTSSFYRKGTSGDWKNHFTPNLKATFKNVIGKQLIELGYEQDLNW